MVLLAVLRKNGSSSRLGTKAKFKRQILLYVFSTGSSKLGAAGGEEVGEAASTAVRARRQRAAGQR